MTLTLYSTGCPQCKFLEASLKQKGYTATIIHGAERIKELGYNSAPLLEVDGKIMKFAEAVAWLKSAEKAGDVNAG